MKIRIIAVAKKPQTWMLEAEKDFLNRVKSFAGIDITLIPPSDENSLGSEKAKSIESQRILTKISDDDFVIACEPSGEALSSETFAEIFRTARDNSSKVICVIGGSQGLDSSVLDRASKKISFSKMTFPHGLFRVVLLEQIYRAFMIMSGKKYHK